MISVRSSIAMGCLVAVSLAATARGQGRGERGGASESLPLMAGASAIDITPKRLPVLQSGGFLSRTVDRVAAPLYARCLALKNRDVTIALVIVDSCMIPREVCDLIKSEAASSYSLRADRILLAATHTHSAPSAMDYCLGTMQDKTYTLQLVPQVVEAIGVALSRLEPAKAGWGVTEAWDYTNSRRWIKRSDKIGEDPFGGFTVRAMMHPNPLSEYVGPSGPEDPALTVLSVVRADDSPLAIMANFSMHYFGGVAGINPDYFGLFVQGLEDQIKSRSPDRPFVGIMSQGTSGDLHLRTYDPDRKDEVKLDMEQYAQRLVSLVLKTKDQIEHRESIPLMMAERELELSRRLPDDSRLAWADRLNKARGDALPKDRPEVYAMQAAWIHENPRSRLVLQALRIGELGLTAMPNEVYGITGLKIKAQSPLPLTMNIELANGADGYIPPPEQHVLGGYTTWPSRTAGLEVEAEPKIVETILSLLEEVAGYPRKKPVETHGAASQMVQTLQPMAYWRMNEMVPPNAVDASGHGLHARYEDGVAFYLPGVSSNPALDMASATPQQPNPFSGTQINRGVHFAGGRLHAKLVGVASEYSVSLWLWNGFPVDVRPFTGFVFSRGNADGQGDHLGIGGSDGKAAGKLVFLDGQTSHVGKTNLGMRRWHHVTMTRDGDEVRVYLDGNPVPEIELKSTVPFLSEVEGIYVGGRSDRQFGFEGKIDEVAFFDRVLQLEEIRQIFDSSGRPVPGGERKALSPRVQPPVSTQPALEPMESLACLKVPEGFEATLVAAEPQVLDPVAFDWDEKGRLWVVEMADYPLGMDGEGKTGGRVRRLEDLDRDGNYETSVLFADELSFPNGILTWRDGVIVTAAPDILFLKDTDGDGRADHREVLITGLNEGNQQLRPNGLRWGLDNWVYVASGSPGTHYAGKAPLKSMRNGKTLELGTSDFRFRPDSGEIELESGPTQFGRNRDDWGHWFGTQNIRPLWHYVMAEHYLRRNPYVASGETSKNLLKLPAPVFPAHAPEKRFHNFATAGFYTSACGGVIHRDGRLFGPLTFGFTCEPFHNLVQQIQVIEDGVTYSGKVVSHQKQDFLTSTDRWTRPVMVRTGPDGGLWVADMYRFMIEHPQFLPPEGKAELLPHYRKGDDRGRIYRILKKGMPIEPIADLSRLSVSQWIGLLHSENGFIRDKAHQLLVWKEDPSSVAELKQVASDTNHPFASLHALCVLDGMRALDAEDLLPALQANHEGLRENALRLAEPWLRQATVSSPLLQAVIDCSQVPSLKVRFQTALTLGESNDVRAGLALGMLMQEHHADSWMLTGILTSAVPHLATLVDSVRQAEPAVKASTLRPLLQIALGRNDREASGNLLAMLDGSPDDPQTIDALKGYLEAMSTVFGDGKNPLDPAMSDRLAHEIRRIDMLLSRFLDYARREDVPLERRLPIALMVNRSPQHQSASLDLVASWLDIGQPLEVQIAVIKALAQSGAERVPETYSAFWPSSGPAARSAMLEGWMSREAWCYDLITRLRKKEISVAALDVAQRSRLLNHPVRRVANQALLVLGEATSTRGEIVKQYQASLNMVGVPDRGHVVYQKVCAACHRHGAEGFAIGPDMVAFTAHSPEKLLTNILDPNIDIQPGFQAFACILHSGEQLFGVIAQENSASITLKGKDGLDRTILRSEIEALKGTNVSFMPEGLESLIDLQQMADLLAFLKQPLGNDAEAGERKTPN